jgi:hypothetical protein
MTGRTETYQGPVEIDFGPNESVTVHLTDGRTADLFSDGSWQVWTAPVRDILTNATNPAQMIGQGSFDALPDPAAAAHAG